MDIQNLTPEECMTIWNGLMELPSKQTFALLNQKIVPQYAAAGLIKVAPASAPAQNDGSQAQPEVRITPDSEKQPAV